MKKALDEKKYLGVFKKKSGDAVEQLKILIQFLENPDHVLLSAPTFFKNLLSEYNLLSEHRNHNLVHTLLAIIAAYERQEDEFHQLLLKIIYIGQFDHSFLCASLSCIARFVGKKECCDDIYESVEMDQAYHVGFDQLSNLVEENEREFDEIVEVNDLPKLCTFYFQSASMFQVLSCSNDVAFQYFLNTQTRFSTQNLVDLWGQLFFYCLSNPPDQWPRAVDKVSFALADVITHRDKGYSKLLKKVSFSTIVNYLSDFASEKIKLMYLLRTLGIFLTKPEKIHSMEKEQVCEIIFNLIFVINNDADIINLGIEVAKMLLLLCEYDNEFLPGIRRFLNQHIESKNFNEVIFNDRLAIMIKYLCENNSSVILNHLLKILTQRKQFVLVAKTLVRLPNINGQVVVPAMQAVQKPREGELSLLNPEHYIDCYHFSLSVRAAQNMNGFNELVTFVVNGLNRSHDNHEAVFCLMHNILVQHCHHKAFTDTQKFAQLRTSNRKRLSKAFLAFINNPNESMLVLKFITQTGKNLVQHFDLESADINAILTSIIHYLAMNARNADTILKMVEHFDRIMTENINIICLPKINTLFVENILVVLERELNLHLLPMIYLLFRYRNKLELDQTQMKRIQHLLVSLSQQMIKINTEESRSTLFTMLGWIRFEDLKALYQALPSDQTKNLAFLVEKVVPALEAALRPAVSPLKLLVSRVFE